jgi:hypothetical protein
MGKIGIKNWECEIENELNLCDNVSQIQFILLGTVINYFFLSQLSYFQ